MSKQLYEKIGKEYKPINPIIKLDDIIDSISENSILSMLLKSNHYYIEYSNSIESTRDKVPLTLRRKGLWITYNNGKEDITECFIGKNNEIDEHWSDDNNWKNLTYIKVEENSITYQHLNDNLKRAISENKKIINFPDDEDLITEGNVLKFANKEYNPNTFSGLGEVIIRKNIKNINEENKNIITNYDFNKENTIYVIKYDFDLNGNTITIPKNCVLKYKGGSLNNGTLIYTDTIIEGVERLSNINIEGNYKYPYTGDETSPDDQLAPTLRQVRKLSTEVNNIADDEDLTKIYDEEKGQEVLQLKDRQYVQDSNSGMGYVILRQNKSFVEQVIEANTIYEIRYDFDLGGEEIEIPESCALKFEGGSVRNGVLIGDKTQLLGEIVLGVILQGSYDTEQLSVSNFLYTNCEELSSIVVSLFNLENSVSLFVDKDVELTCDDVKINRLLLRGNGTVITNMFYAEVDGNIEIRDISLRYTDDTKTGIKHSYLSNSANLTISHANIYGCKNFYYSAVEGNNRKNNVNIDVTYSKFNNVKSAVFSCFAKTIIGRFEYNEFDNIGQTAIMQSTLCIHCGQHDDSTDEIKSNAKIKVSHNTFGMIYTPFASTNDIREAHCIILAGDGCVVEYNQIEGISSSEDEYTPAGYETEAIYLKSAYSTITHNVIRHGTSIEGEGAIICKRSSKVFVDNNVIISNNGAGIVLLDIDGSQVINNYIDIDNLETNKKYTGIKVQTKTAAAYQNIISKNTIRYVANASITSANQRVGIVCSLGDNVVTENIVSEAAIGIQMYQCKYVCSKNIIITLNLTDDNIFVYGILAPSVGSGVISDNIVELANLRCASAAIATDTANSSIKSDFVKITGNDVTMDNVVSGNIFYSRGITGLHISDNTINVKNCTIEKLLTMYKGQFTPDSLITSNNCVYGNITSYGENSNTGDAKPLSDVKRTIGDVFILSGKPVFWNGTTWVDANGTEV